MKASRRSCSSGESVWGTAPRPAANAFSLSSAAASWPLDGVNSHGRPRKHVGSRVLDPAARRAAEWMTADERQAIRKRRRGVDDRPLGAAGVGHDCRAGDVLAELAKHLEVLLNGRREDDEIRFGQHHRIVCGDVDGVQHHRALEHVFAIDANHETGRPDLPRRQRNRSADEPESDDADALEDRRLSRVLLRLQHRQLLSLRHSRSPIFQSPISNLPILPSVPSRASPRARRRCCVRSPAR